MFVATQALLLSSEPLSLHGLDRWQLCPPNSMIIAAPTRPMAGRCKRSELVANLKAPPYSSTLVFLSLSLSILEVLCVIS